MNFFKIILLAGICLVFGSAISLAKEKPLPTFKITGYVEKINSDSINVFVPRMKQSIYLFLAKKVKVVDFTHPEQENRYSLADLREKYLAVFEGIISQKGFVCEIISFVRSI